MQISMIDGALFDALEALARGIRGKQEPFGGIQLILAGQNCSTLSAVSYSGVLSAAQFFLYAGRQQIRPSPSSHVGLNFEL